MAETMTLLIGKLEDIYDTVKRHLSPKQLEAFGYLLNSTRATERLQSECKHPRAQAGADFDAGAFVPAPPFCPDCGAGMQAVKP